MFNKISVVGLGYIGLPTAAVIASKGIEVVGVDVNEHAVNTINEGRIHIVEPGLEAMVKSDVEKGLLKAYLTPQPADAFLIAAPTPFKGNNYEPNLDYIESASKAIARKNGRMDRRGSPRVKGIRRKRRQRSGYFCGPLPRARIARPRNS